MLLLLVHSAGAPGSVGSQCVGRPCVVHAPSDHHMTSWPLNWRADTQVMELASVIFRTASPPYDAHVPREQACRSCEVTWHGPADSRCWVCGALGRPGTVLSPPFLFSWHQ
jgi:hypothetical protein